MSREIDLYWYDPDDEVQIRILNYESFTETEKKFLEDLTNWLKGKDIKNEMGTKTIPR